jgi:hypothetical protein
MINPQSSSLPPLRRPARPTARLALGQNASPVIPTYTSAKPLSWSRTPAMIVKIGVRRDMNASGVGRIFDFGDVTRFISVAERPIIRTIATIPAPRQMLPREVPVARWTAAVVMSRGSGCEGSFLRLSGFRPSRRTCESTILLRHPRPLHARYP